MTDQEPFNPYKPPAGDEDEPRPIDPSLRERLSIQQLNLGGLFSVGWGLFLHNVKTIMLVSLAIYMPVNVVLAYMPYDVEVPDAITQITSYWRLVWLLDLLVGALAVMAVTWSVDRSVDGERVGFGEAIMASLRRWGHAIGTSLLGGIIIFALLLCVIVPGIIYAVYYTFTLPPVILCQMGGKRALDHSKSLVSGRWWQVLGIGLVIAVCNMLLQSTIGVPLGILDNYTGYMPLVSGLLSGVGDSLGSYFTAMEAVWFINLHQLRQAEERSVELVDDRSEDEEGDDGSASQT